ncbi:MAG: hypothetical protein HS099_18785 [Ardenticatenaceae bacterium]|nr:hypothetical protein [Ardenticatenaceae bacterium]
MRIIHPNHPLVGQTAVIKRILPATHRQPARYLIHHPQTGTVNIPQAWAISAPDTARHELADMAESLPAAPTVTAPIPLVTLHTLLALAKLVQTMQAQAPEETHDPTPTAPGPPHLGEPAPDPAVGTQPPAGRPADPISDGAQSGAQTPGHQPTTTGGNNT